MWYFAFIYNALGVPIAAGALYPFFGLLLSPMIAGGAMSFSSGFSNRECAAFAENFAVKRGGSANGNLPRVFVLSPSVADHPRGSNG
jgi:hypothetical protein